MMLKSLNEKVDDLKVLYVEDEKSIREAVTELLRRRVELLFVAENGEAGLEVFEKEQPDIVITDIRMPRMDGLKMSRRIKEINPEVKIIITSAYSDSDFFIEAIDIGINEYVLKPIGRNKLFEAFYKSAEAIYMHRKLAKQWQTITKLHSAMEQSQSLVIITDANRKVEFLNKRFSEITGFSFEEINQKKSLLEFQSLCDPELNPGLKKVLELGKDWRGEYLIRHKNGEQVPLFGSFSPVLDVHGEVSSFVLVGEDISEIKKMSRALADSEDKLRNLIEKLGEGICILDLTYDFVFCNEAMGDIFETQNLLEKNLSVYLPVTEEMAAISEAARALKVGEKKQQEVSLLTAKGTMRYVSITITPQLNPGGRGITGLFCIFKDITRIRELITQLEAARDASEEAYQTIEDKNAELNNANVKLQESEYKLSELNAILMEYIKATGK